MKPRPLSVTITLALIFLGAISWLALGSMLALNAHPAFPDDPSIRGAMAVASTGAALILFVLALLLEKRRRFAYFGALAALAAASLAIFLDDVGAVDLAVLAISAVPLMLLIKDRAWYLRLKT
ncbi:MAG: hypothetical protein V1755_13225 [Chloroflexota bacterium]